MENIKLELAKQVCESEGYELFPGRCDECGFPLLQKNAKGVWFVGCWFCSSRRERAVAAQATLHKARLASQGIIIEAPRAPMVLEPKEDNILPGRQMYGAPL